MKFIIPIVVVVVTAVLVAWGTLLPQQAGATLGVASGAAFPGLSSPAGSPDKAIADLLTSVRKRDWHAAFLSLANRSTLDEDLFARDLSGGNGSLRTLSGLQGWDLQPLHLTADQGEERATLHWSTPVGPIDDVRDVHVQRQDGAWKVLWAVPEFPNVPTQVVPVNYLRWDLVTSNAHDAWGEGNLDAPRARIISMNAVESDTGAVVMGEVVNEDTVPAFVNVNATLIGQNGKPLDEENSFDKIAHVLLPKQVTPYRIDFPKVNLRDVKNVQMDLKATLVPASADPVVGVMNQSLTSDALGRKILRGELLDQSGQVVGIPHVIATFYDNSGKVIWVADGYVERALFPQTPEPFSIAIPNAVADKAQSYHVVVNQFSADRS
jgi:hypothetical protein